nr:MULTISPECIES: hypothetical protein [Lactobacillus]
MLKNFDKTEIPNETSEKAMLLADAKDKGLVSDDSSSFTNIDDLMNSLDEE